MAQFISNQSSISVKLKALDIILEFDVIRADLESYALTTLSFLSFETEIYDRRQRKRQRSQGWWNPLVMHRAGTKGFVLLTSLCSKADQVRKEARFPLVYKFIPFLDFSLWKQGCHSSGSFISWTLSKEPVTDSTCGRLQPSWQMLFLSVPIDPDWGDGAFQTGCPPKVVMQPWRKKNLFRIQNQDLVSANSERQRPVAQTLSLQKVCWIDTYLTSADTSYSPVFYCFTYI